LLSEVAHFARRNAKLGILFVVKSMGDIKGEVNSIIHLNSSLGNQNRYLKDIVNANMASPQRRVKI
jgi:hypothetical protein